MENEKKSIIKQQSLSMSHIRTVLYSYIAQIPPREFQSDYWVLETVDCKSCCDKKSLS